MQISVTSHLQNYIHFLLCSPSVVPCDYLKIDKHIVFTMKKEYFENKSVITQQGLIYLQSIIKFQV